MLKNQNKKFESILVIWEDFLDKEIPQEKESFSVENGISSFKIEEKDFINSLVKIKIFCECDHGIEKIIDLKKIPISYLLQGSKIKRYRYKFICNSCERLFFIPLKVNELHTKNPHKTVREHYKEMEIIEVPQDYSLNVYEQKDNHTQIESLQRLIEFHEQRRLYLISQRYENICLKYEETKKLIADNFSLEYLKEMQDIDTEAFKFLNNISKIIHDNLLKSSTYEEESIKKQLIRIRWDFKRYRQYKKKLHDAISQSISLLRNCKYELSLKYLEKSKKPLNFLSGFPIFNTIEDIFQSVRRFSLGFIKFSLIDGIFRCFISMNSFFTKKKYSITCSEFDKFLYKAIKSKYYKQIRDKIIIIKDLHTEVLNEYYDFCLRKGASHYKNRDKEAVKYYRTAKNLAKQIFIKKGPVIVQLLQLIEESSKF